MTILLVETDKDLISAINTYMHEVGFEVFVANSFHKASEILRTELFDVIVADVGTSKGKISSLLKDQQIYNPMTPVIVSAEFKNAHDAVNAIKMGAHNFIHKPYDVEDLHQRIIKAIEFHQLDLEAQSLRGERELIYRPEDFVSESPEMDTVLHMVKKVAASDVSVILTGETGTGKELISGAIHYNSRRAKKAFVKVNCAALPVQLLESELFGHERGAFTGAERTRIGRFEQASGGSILLDEISEMDISIQVKLLRVLQEREVERLGSNRTIKLDVRVMTATNKNLPDEIEAGRFRNDLYYRLNVINIHIPPLRERKSDILPLARFFLVKFSRDLGKSVRDFDQETLRTLMDYQWPGNVRELRNTIERAVLLSDGDTIGISDLNIRSAEAANTISTEGLVDSDGIKFIRIPRDGLSLKELEEDLIRQALNATHYVQKDAARLLRISPRVLNYKIAKYGITNPHWSKNT